MIPLGPILIGLSAGLRAVNRHGAAGPTPSTSRGTHDFWNDGGAGATVAFQLFLLLFLIGGWVGVSEAQPVAIALGLGGGVLLFPWWVARRVLVPLGLARSAYRLAWFSRVTWRRDKPGGPALAAAWALARARAPASKDLAWVEAKLGASKRALQASSVAALGLLAAAKGQRAEARRLLESVFRFDRRIAVRAVRVISAEWLATDAASEGRWDRIEALATDRSTPWTPTLLLLRQVATLELGEPVPPWRLWAAWLLAPHRLRTFSFVRRAARRPSTVETAAEGIPAPSPGFDALGAALHAHRAFALREPSAREVASFAQAWERALGEASLRDRLFQRATVLGGGDPDGALDEVRALVEAELGARATAPRDEHSASPMPELLDRALYSRREELYAELEDRMTRMNRRKQERRDLPPAEEWREFTSLTRTYEALCALGGASERAVAHSIIRDRLVNFAVWLFNVRVEKPLANAIFRYLESEAISLNDPGAAELNRENAACGL